MNNSRLVYTAHFSPQAWQRDYAVEVDAEGPVEWNCTAYAEKHRAYLVERALEQHEQLTGYLGVLDSWDWFKDDPQAPEWIRSWHGPFDIRITARDSK